MITCLSVAVIPTATAQETPSDPYPQVREENFTQIEDYVPNRDEPSPAEEITALDPDAPDVDGYYRNEPPSEAPPENLPEPKDEVTPGMMRSDNIEVPEGYTKQEADRAEVREAQLDRQALTRTAGQTCKIFWPSPYQVCGAILERYEVIGGPVSWLGLPESDELVNPDGTGRRSEFLGGNIYWHPNHGAHSVAPDAAKQWNTLGYETGRLGYPVDEAFSTSTPLIYGQRYSGGDIYYSPLTGGTVWGDIKSRYDQLGGADHPIGVPITNELDNTPSFKYTKFSNGTMSWRGNDRTTRFMYFNTQKVWDALGRETGEYGFPSGDENPREPGVFHTVPFENRGTISWSSLFGARELTGQAYIYWETQLGTSEDIGYPIPDILPFSQVSTQRFSRGSIMSSGESIAVIPRSDAPRVDSLTENEYPSSEGFNNSTSELQRSNVVSRGLTPEEEREEKYPHAGYRVSNKTPGIFPKTKPYVGGNRFVVRQGFFEEDWCTGDDIGWGEEKLINKHNMSNHPILFAVINEGVMNSDLPHEKNTYPYTERVFFLKCGQFSINGNRGCKQSEAPQYVTVLFRPVVNNLYKGAPAKDPRVSTEDNWVVGVVTASCHDKKSEANGHGESSSYCPDYVNLYSQLKV